MKMKNGIVAFSGGKDSTAAVLLLKKAGMAVRAMFMKTGLADEEQRESRIKRLAAELGVPLSVVDAGQRFRRSIIHYFIKCYRHGLTPNPCVRCNQTIKFGLLRDIALNQEDADYFATGHYADCFQREGRYYLREPLDRQKSQVYFLSLIRPGHLERTLFPLAHMRVEEVRGLVRGYPLVHHRESQDVCFLQGSSLMDFLKDHIPDAFAPGDILDVYGKRIGGHNGIIYFTIGQRRGTRFSSGKKLYVIKKDVKNNTITLGEAVHLFSEEIRIAWPVFWRDIREGEVFQARVRYLGAPVPLRVARVSGRRILASFEKPVRAITPGQICALYQNDVVAAAGFIE